MRVTLLNDTRSEINPGCQATVDGLIGLIRDTVGAPPRTVRFGEGYDAFAHMVADGHARSETHWQQSTAALASNAAIQEAIDADLVIVNLEGTFHHHNVGALALGGIIAMAHHRQVPVWAVNGTVEDIEPWLLRATLADCAHVAVREPISAAWLRERGVRATLSADCALLADVFASPGPSTLPRRAALYTPGVLARPGHVAHVGPDTALAHMARVAEGGLTPVYLEMEDAEAPISTRVRETGGVVVRAADIPWSSIGNLMRECELVVSGRYHVLLFAAMAGVPAIALPSNTWKIAGLLEHLAATPRAPDDHLAAQLGGVAAGVVPAAALERLRTLARLNVTDVEGIRAADRVRHIASRICTPSVTKVSRKYA